MEKYDKVMTFLVVIKIILLAALIVTLIKEIFCDKCEECNEA